MNLNITFSSFQETGQTGTKLLLKLLPTPEFTNLNN